MSSRRGHNEGTFYRRADGTWCGQLRVGNGQRLTYYGKTKAEVQQKLAKGRALHEAGRLSPNTRQSLGEYLDGWLSSIKPSVRPKTFESYTLNVQRLNRHIGTVRLSSLTPAHIQGCYSLLHSDGLSPRSIEQAHTVLHGALERAVHLELLQRNPSDPVSVPRPQRSEMQTLSADQALHLFRVTEGERFHALWVLLATTGLRLGEAMGLQWRDLDLETGRLVVQRALQRQKEAGLVFVEPKSRSSRRTVILSDAATKALREHHERQLETARLLESAWMSSDMVFTAALGGPVDPSAVNAYFNDALKRSGLPRIRVHDLRHTAASLLLAEGIHPKVVQEILGHSSISLTLGTYSHVLPSLHTEAAKKLDALFNRKTDREHDPHDGPDVG
jgi:integrase